MGPVIGNIGNLQFVLTAVLGGLLSVTGVGGITLGVMASYLQFTKSFTQPFMQWHSSLTQSLWLWLVQNESSGH